MKTVLGQRIAHYREQSGMTQLQLGRAVGVDKGTVWRWEDGRSTHDFAKAQEIAKAVGIGLNESPR